MYIIPIILTRFNNITRLMKYTLVTYNISGIWMFIIHKNIKNNNNI